MENLTGGFKKPMPTNWHEDDTHRMEKENATEYASVEESMRRRTQNQCKLRLMYR
jgi:hypothetical protein